MFESRISVNDGSEFNPREWLRREVLWASLMAPYGQQFDSWINGTRLAQHNGNTSRRALYAQFENDPEAQALSFFNHGKTVGGLVSSSTVFRVRRNEPLRHDEEISDNMLRVQAKCAEIALQDVSFETLSNSDSDEHMFSEATRLAVLADRTAEGTFTQRQYLLRAGKILSALAQKEAATWLIASRQNDDRSLPVLTIPNGGHPRSAGPRVDMLLPIFHKIVESERYQDLTNT